MNIKLKFDYSPKPQKVEIFLALPLLKKIHLTKLKNIEVELLEVASKLALLVKA